MREYFQRVVTFENGMYYGDFYTSRALCESRREPEMAVAKSGNAAIISEEITMTTMHRL